MKHRQSLLGALKLEERRLSYLYRKTRTGGHICETLSSSKLFFAHEKTGGHFWKPSRSSTQMSAQEATQAVTAGTT